MNIPPINVISIDPGNNMGVCISIIDPSTMQMIVLDAFTLIMDKAIKSDSYEVVTRYSKRQRIEMFIRKWLPNLLDDNNIDVLVYEAAYNSRSIVAYESLLFYGNLFAQIGEEYDYDLLIDSLAPSAVKKNIGVKGNSGDKDLMTTAVLNNPNIIFNDDIDTESLSEHAIDAIAIGYSVLNDLRE